MVFSIILPYYDNFATFLSIMVLMKHYADMQYLEGVQKVYELDKVVSSYMMKLSFLCMVIVMLRRKWGI